MFRNPRRRNVASRTRSAAGRNKRQHRVESLELRTLLAGDWQSEFNVFDVDDNSVVVPQDVLVAVNELNARTIIDAMGQLPARTLFPDAPFYDVNGDGFLAPLDVLPIVNALNLDTSPPAVTAALARDTAPWGATNLDRITFDATIAGTVADDLTGVTLLRASVDGGAFTTVPLTRSATPRTMQFQFVPGELTDGLHAVMFRATDPRSNQSLDWELAFEFDNVPPPTPPQFSLARGSQQTPGDDSVAAAQRVTLVGQADPHVFVQLAAIDAITSANSDGVFRFTDVPLSVGANELMVLASDVAGNTQSGTATVARLEEETQDDVVLFWNQVALDSIVRDASTPLFASRNLAITQSAVLEAVNAVNGLPGQFITLAAPDDASLEAAVAGAAHRTLSELYPAQSAALDAALALSLDSVPDGTSEDEGRQFGAEVAELLLAWRADDGSRAFVTYDGSDELGAWRPTLVNFDPALLPQWAHVSPFVMASSDQFRPPAPPALDSAQYANDVLQVQELGAVNSQVRTAEQTQIARFWSDGAGTYTPPGHWNQIAQTVARALGNSLDANARLLAMLNVALADAGISAWDAKYAYNVWRPLTAIHEAAVDGNDATVADPSWAPLLPTPPFPSYTSGHSTFSGAAAAVLTSVFGEQVTFSDSSVGLPSVTRTFESFDEAAQEAGISRIYGGIHYLFDSTAGLASGRSVGELVAAAFAGDDQQAPLVLVTEPRPDSVLAADPVVRGRVSDAVSGVASFTVAIDQEPAEGVPFDPVTGVFSFNPPSLADGRHELRLVATDHLGHTTERILVITVDRVAPELFLGFPFDGELLDGNSILMGNADATGSGLVQLSYQFDDGTEYPVAFEPATGAFDTRLPVGNLPAGSHLLKVRATDAAGNQATATVMVELAEPGPFELSQIAPLDGAIDVGVTFRPKIVFSRAVDPATLTADNVFLSFGGAKLPATIVPSPDGSFAVLFPASPLPGGAQITLTVDGSTILAPDGTPLDAGLSGVPGSSRSVRFTTVSTSGVPGTSISGVLVDPGPDRHPMTRDDIRPGADGLLNSADDQYLLPLSGVTIYVIGRETSVVTTDANGHFTLGDVPSGNVKLVVDGRTATNAPAGIYFPEMVMDLQIEAGRDNTLMGSMGEREKSAALEAVRGVYLPRLETALLRTVDNATGLMIGTDANSAPELTPEQRSYLHIDVPPGSLIGADGQPLAQAEIGISTVPPELVRDMLPAGILQHTFDITIQAPDVATFAVPIPVTVPNVFQLAPGEKLNLLSFDHTTGRLVIEGTMTVSADGKFATTDPGVGIVHPGWHGPTPGTECEPCQVRMHNTDGGDPGGGPGEAEGTAELEVTGNGFDDHFITRQGETFRYRFKNKLPESEGEEGVIKLRIDIDGPYNEFLEGLKNVGNRTFEICPQQELSFRAMVKDLVSTITGLRRDRLYGANLHFKATLKGQVIYDESYNLLRFVSVIDPDTVMHPDDAHADALFVKALADGQFVRTKDVDYFLPKKTAKVSLSLGGANAGVFDLGQSNDLSGNGQARWTFEPGALNNIAHLAAPIEIRMTRGERSMIGTLQARGTAIGPTTLAPNRAQFIAQFEAYLRNPVHFAASSPLRASQKFRTDFAAVLPASNPTPAAITAAATAAYDALSAGLRRKYEQLNGANSTAIRFADTGGNVAVNWHETTLGTLTFNGASQNFNSDFGVTVTDRNYNGNSAGRLYESLRSNIVPNAAKEYVLAEEINLNHQPGSTGGGVLANNFVHYAIGMLASVYNSSLDFGAFVANTVAHEMAHTFGVLDSYVIGQPGNVPNDLMSAKNAMEGARLFEFNTNGRTVQAAVGLAPNQVGALQAAVDNYRRNFNKPGSAAGIQALDPDPQPYLVVSHADSFLVPDGMFFAGEVLADGAGNNQLRVELVLSNEGGLPLTITDVSLGGTATAYSLAGTPAAGTVLMPGDRVPIELVFDPSLPGNAVDSLRVVTDPPAAGTEVPFGGLGITTQGQIAATFQPHPSSNLIVQNNVGGAVVDGEAVTAAAFLTFTNLGGGPLTITDFVWTRGAGEYSVTGLPAGFGPDQPFVLAPGESIDVDVSFHPTKTGLLPGTLTVMSDDPTQAGLPLHVIGTGLSPAGTGARPGHDFVVIQSIETVGAPALRQKSDRSGYWKFVLPPRSAYEYAIFDPESGLIAASAGVSQANGVRTIATRPVFDVSTEPDSDGDGLPDDIEFAIGTSIREIDSNDDGVDDFASIVAGLDPLANRGFPTGILASVGLAGNALDVELASAANDPTALTAYVATTSGLSIIDVSQPDRPIQTGQVSWNGGATHVAVDASNALAFLASGAQGLRVVDLSDAANPRLVETVSLPGGAGPLVAYDGVVYVSSGGSLVFVDQASGQEFGSLPMPSGITGLARDGQMLYVMEQSRRLSVVDLSGAVPALRGSVVLPFGGGELVVDRSIAYVVANGGGGVTGGYGTVDVSDPDAPRLIAGLAEDPGIRFEGMLALNGAGVGLLAGRLFVGFAGQPTALLLDTSDPAQTFQFVSQFDVLRPVHDAVIGAGIGFLANDAAGLQVLNYLPWDDGGVAPAVQIVSPVEDLDPLAAGIQVREGTDVVIRVDATDDVQLRQVELLRNGTVIATRVSFPLDFLAPLPLLASGATEANFQVRVTDTGGNVALSNRLRYQLVADTTPPAIAFTSPAADSEVASASGVVVVFDEAIRPERIRMDGVTLTREGTPVPLRQVVARSSRALSIVPTAHLPFGRYQVTVDPDMIEDRAGNALAVPLQFSFLVGTAQVIGAQPAPSSVADAPVIRVTLDFSTDIQSGIPAPADFTLSGAGPDGAFGTNDDLSVGFTSLAFNAGRTQLSLDLAAALTPGTYRMTAPAARLQDRFGRPLDGEFDTAFPTGNGQPGGDFQFEFTVVPPGTMPFDAFAARVAPNFSTVNLPVSTVFHQFSPIVTADLNGDGLTDVVRTIHAQYFAGFSGGQQVFSPLDQVSILYGRTGGGFQDPVVINVGVGAARVAIDDLNGDGHPDIVVLDSPGNVNQRRMFELSVLLGTGTGFLPELRITTNQDANEPGALVIAEVTGDQTPDVVVLVPRRNIGTPAALNRLLVFPGIGDGTFAAPSLQEIPSDEPERQLLAGDVNGDQIVDLVTSHHVLIGANNGTFAISPLNLGGTTLLTLADLNEDQVLDVVVSNPVRAFDEDTFELVTDSVELKIGLGNGQGGFASSTTTTVPVGGSFGGDNFSRFVTAIARDLNGDQHVDLAVAGTLSEVNPQGSVAVLHGAGDGTFAPGPMLPFYDSTNRFHPAQVAWGDNNGDLRPDLFLGLPMQNSPVPWRTAVVLNSDTGLESPQFDPSLGLVRTGGNGFVERQGADVNGDGKRDLVRFTNLLNGQPPALEISLGMGDGSFAPPVSGLSAPLPANFGTDLELGDVNGDGRIDAIVWDRNLSSGDGSTVNGRLLLGQPSGQFGAAAPLLQDTFAVQELRLADVNSDGDLDVVRMGSFTGLRVRLGDGTGAFGADVVSNFQQTGFTEGTFLLADVNHDDILDAVNPGNNAALGQGDGTFVRAARPFLGILAGSVTLADVNGDTHLDVIIGGSHAFRVNYGIGDGTFQDFVTFALPNVSLFDAQSADVNGDGIRDLIFSGDGEIDILLSLGDGTFQPVIRLDAPGLPRPSGTTVPGIRPFLDDFDGDGLLDILASATVLLRKPN